LTLPSSLLATFPPRPRRPEHLIHRPSRDRAQCRRKVGPAY
jgi:hypothetical protein